MFITKTFNKYNYFVHKHNLFNKYKSYRCRSLGIRFCTHFHTSDEADETDESEESDESDESDDSDESAKLIWMTVPKIQAMSRRYKTFGTMFASCY